MYIKRFANLSLNYAATLCCLVVIDKLIFPYTINKTLFVNFLIILATRLKGECSQQYFSCQVKSLCSNIYQFS